jgi:DNA-binding response OmpR family regulator
LIGSDHEPRPDARPETGEDSLLGSIVVEEEETLGSILVVEDDPDHAALLSESLTGCGYRVDVAHDGLEALHHLRRERFDLVVSDLNMPRVDGLDLLEMIRDQAMEASVLILSGERSIAKAVAAMKLGAVSYLEKPFDLGALKREVRAALRGRRGSEPVEPRGGPATRQIRPRSDGDVSQISRYRVQEVLGTGGMGTVYRCFDPTLDRSVAVKAVAIGDMTSDLRAEMVERFGVEARAVGRLRHPRIVTVHDFGEDHARGLLFLAMELVEGQSLLELQQASGKLTWQFVVAIAHQVADALDHAHRAGVIHRDIKPANILVDASDRVKLVDFGVAKLSSASLTHAGTVLGTPSYLAPEMLAGDNFDHRADQFSLGTVMIEALSGKKIFAAESFEALALQIMTRETPSFQELGIAAPAALEEIVQRLHRKDPAARYQDESQLIESLAQLGTPQPPH